MPADLRLVQGTGNFGLHAHIAAERERQAKTDACLVPLCPLASVHKYLRICDLCKELAFGSQHAGGECRSSYNSFEFNVLCRQFLESVHKYLRIRDLCKELAFGSQHAGGECRSSYNSFEFNVLCRQFLESRCVCSRVAEHVVLPSSHRTERRGFLDNASA